MNIFEFNDIINELNNNTNDLKSFEDAKDLKKDFKFNDITKGLKKEPNSLSLDEMKALNDKRLNIINADIEIREASIAKKKSIIEKNKELIDKLSVKLGGNNDDLINQYINKLKAENEDLSFSIQQMNNTKDSLINDNIDLFNSNKALNNMISKNKEIENKVAEEQKRLNEEKNKLTNNEMKIAIYIANLKYNLKRFTEKMEMSSDNDVKDGLRLSVEMTATDLSNAYKKINTIFKDSVEKKSNFDNAVNEEYNRLISSNVVNNEVNKDNEQQSDSVVDLNDYNNITSNTVSNETDIKENNDSDKKIEDVSDESKINNAVSKVFSPFKKSVKKISNASSKLLDCMRNKPAASIAALTGIGLVVGVVLANPALLASIVAMGVGSAAYIEYEKIKSK